MKLILSIIFTLLVSSAVCDDIEHVKCNHVGRCNVDKVRINPCPRPEGSKLCHFKPGLHKDFHVDFDYTTEFDAANPESKILWTRPAGNSFSVTIKDVCSHDPPRTECPIEANKKTNFKKGMPIPGSFTSGIYELEIKLYDKSNEAECCCFKSKVKMTE